MVVLHSTAGLATQILVQDLGSDDSCLLDLGDGTCRDLLAVGTNLLDVSTVLISHGHYDHVGGLYSFLGMLRMLGRQNLLTIAYPSGAVEVEGIIALSNKLSDIEGSFEVGCVVLPADKPSTFTTQSFHVATYPVVHYSSVVGGEILNQVPALAYKLKHVPSGTTIAYSGDTGPSEVLWQLYSPEVDLALVEATHPDRSWIRQKVRYHLTVEEAQDYCAKAKKSILIHRLPDFVTHK